MRQFNTTIDGQPSIFEGGETGVGKWLSGPLAGRPANPCRRTLRGKSPLPEPRTEKPKRAANPVPDLLLAALTEGPVAVHQFANAHSTTERAVRGAIGTLRRAGHTVTAQGGGLFRLEGK